MDYIQVSAKTVNDAITEACQKLLVTSDKLEYEVIDEGLDLVDKVQEWLSVVEVNGLDKADYDEQRRWE